MSDDHPKAWTRQYTVTMGRPVRAVNGHCPMGCGPTLGLSGSGDVVCCNKECSRTSAVHELLADTETEHIVHINDQSGWTIRHPLRERLDDELMRCALHDLIAALSLRYDLSTVTGRHRVTRSGDRWHWEEEGA